MRLAYFDCFSGASGDMILGALLACGVDADSLRTELRKVPDLEWELQVEAVSRRGISATQVHLTSPDHRHERSCAEILELLARSDLAPATLETVNAVFRTVAEAEARIHGTTPDQIHFHELGGIDSILDIVGAVVGLELLGVDEIHASPLPLSHGTVQCAHGEFPVPAPAVVEILQGVPLYATDVEGELVTPTGAAVLKTLAKSFGAPPPFCPLTVGYGSGTRDLGSRPNVLRLIVGQSVEGTVAGHSQPLQLLETNLDDMNPEFYEYIMQRLFEAGALDVTLSPLQMKKNRPATLVRVLCEPCLTGALRDILLAETTTLGVREHTVQRYCRPRTSMTVETPFGSVRVKAPGEAPPFDWVSPEYDDCAARAREHNVPLQTVYAAARNAALQ